MTPSGDGYPIDLAEGIIDLAGSFLEADRGSQCRAETHPGTDAIERLDADQPKTVVRERVEHRANGQDGESGQKQGPASPRVGSASHQKRDR